MQVSLVPEITAMRKTMVKKRMMPMRKRLMRYCWFWASGSC